MLTFTENLLIRLAGHRPDRDTALSEDYGGLSKVSMAMLVAACLCAVNAGVFAWTLFDHQGFVARCALAAAAALAGLLLVLTFDRGAVYLADTRPDMRWVSKAAYVATSVVIILTMGAFTAQAVMPVLLASELQSQALRMLERSDASRHTALSARLGLADKQTASQRAASAAQLAAQAQNLVPDDIRAALRVAESCWVQYEARRSTLEQHEGIDRYESADRLAATAANCKAKTTQANAARDAHLQAARQSANEARGAAEKATADFDVARGEAARRSTAAAAIEREAFTPKSAEVLAALLAENAGARFKWMLLTVLQVTLELMPLLLKAFAGPTPAGNSIALRRQLAARRVSRQLAEQDQEDIMYAAMKALSDKTAAGVAESPQAQLIMRGEHQRAFAALATLEGTQRFMAALAEHQVRVDSFSGRFPKHASTVARAWHQAVQRAAQVMACGPTDAVSANVK